MHEETYLLPHPNTWIRKIVVDEEITHNGLKALLETLNNYPHYDQINLWKTAIGDEGIVFLGSWIKPNPYLKILDLMDNRIGLEGCRSLSMALQHNECLTTLILDYNEIGDAGAQILSFGVSWNPVLQVISLQYCGISEIGGSAIGNEVVAKSQSLRSLDLQGNPLGPGGVASIAYGLTQTRTLETLSLVDTSFGYDSHCLMQLAKGLEENKTLTSLNLNLNTLDAEGAVMLVSAIKATPSLTKVRIYEKMDSAMFKQFIDAIKANKIKASKKKKKGKRKGGKKKKGAKGKKK